MNPTLFDFTSVHSLWANRNKQLSSLNGRNSTLYKALCYILVYKVMCSFFPDGSCRYLLSLFIKLLLKKKNKTLLSWNKLYITKSPQWGCSDRVSPGSMRHEIVGLIPLQEWHLGNCPQQHFRGEIITALISPLSPLTSWSFIKQWYYAFHYLVSHVNCPKMP